GAVPEHGLSPCPYPCLSLPAPTSASALLLLHIFSPASSLAPAPGLPLAPGQPPVPTLPLALVLLVAPGGVICSEHECGSRTQQ
ncbi:hypothetical protein Pcinc_041462, partial [Petrolisthes cinctipes]